MSEKQWPCSTCRYAPATIGWSHRRVSYGKDTNGRYGHLVLYSVLYSVLYDGQSSVYSIVPYQPRVLSYWS